MLTRILDTSEIDMSDPGIRSALNTDLRRMDVMDHTQMPEGVDHYRVRVTPNPVTYMPGMRRFMYEIQYGKVIGEFQPVGEPIKRSTETLPMI